DDGAVARTALGSFDPFVLGETGIGKEILIADFALGGDVERLVGHINDLVGLADLPADGELSRRRQVGLGAFGRAGVNPAGDELLVAITKTGIVDEVAILGVGMPGGHALLIDDFADGLGPADDFVIVGQ